MINSVNNKTTLSPYLKSVIKNKASVKSPNNGLSIITNKNLKYESKNTTLSKIKKWLSEPSGLETSYEHSRGVQQTRLGAIVHTGLSILSTILVLWFLTKVINNSKIKNLFGFDKNASTPQNIWEDITSAPKLSELSLPDSLKREWNSLLKIIQNPKEHIAKGGTQAKSILLFGPPGTGKTTFAKAIAKELPNSKFASIDLSAIGGKYVGETEGNLNRVVNEVSLYASKNPTENIFVFFDEIDSIAIQDNGSLNQQYHATVLNAFKKALEKLKKSNIIIVGATNVEVDKKGNGSAFVQQLSGPIENRFDKKIRVNNPTFEQFTQAISSHYSKAKMASEYLKNPSSPEVIEIAKTLEEKQASFRDLEGIYNDAASNSKSKILTIEDIRESLGQIFSVAPKKANKIGF